MSNNWIFLGVQPIQSKLSYQFSNTIELNTFTSVVYIFTAICIHDIFITNFKDDSQKDWNILGLVYVITVIL
jgi:branched-subunit amino acid transport protein